LRWIGQSNLHANRWYPVFQRYLSAIAGRVKTFGGEPTKIQPFPLGNGLSHPSGQPDHQGHANHSFTAKIDAIVYDHFGDFVAFVLETRDGARHRFENHETRMLEIVQRAWRLRITTTVIVRHDCLERPLEIVLHETPPMNDAF
jgi:hypothetical protein